MKLWTRARWLGAWSFCKHTVRDSPVSRTAISRGHSGRRVGVTRSTPGSSASFFDVRRDSGSVAIVVLTNKVATPRQAQPLTNGSEEASAPIASSLRNWVSGVRIPPGAPITRTIGGPGTDSQIRKAFNTRHGIEPLVKREDAMETMAFHYGQVDRIASR